MSILADRGLVRPSSPRSVPAGVTRPVRVVRGGRAEPLRPPTRARVVAGRRLGVATASPACPAPRRLPLRWPSLAAMALLVAGVVTGLGLFLAGVPGAAVPERTTTVSVSTGDTLTELAARFAPGSDTGAVVAKIKELNSLEDAVLVPGLPLTVPVAAEVAEGGR
ncbi:LysM peptidoglycan-binding domain-containing protein [Amycolatopsis roodepoortensis]|uniref:LysM peptidoglycan-binding domain-containing protein n=1 Tax=Amycolatopsis roodepoortensis TaxID=700274 RepID=UPI00214C20B0|nr:LysM peptidoglycan-binding domain-containing protein [Amycolatopsis roodepoortensis]UUV33865.1 LysM peptidoglycan-binding domain-containing protein [Amycolatopsis roodepoortensis]